MRPNWDPRGRIIGLTGLRNKFAVLLSALVIGAVATTSFLGFRYAGDNGCIAFVGLPGPLLAPISGGKQVTLKEAVRKATFPVLLLPGFQRSSEVFVFVSDDGATVAFMIHPGSETVYIEQVDRPRSERDEYLDRALGGGWPGSSEMEISGVRTVVQPTCSATDPPQRIGPRLRTGTLYLHGGTHLSELEDIAQAMLRHAAAFHR